MRLTRWTPLTFLAPRRYVSRDSSWSSFDLETWSSDVYRWERDGWNGYLDFANDPAATASTGRGDCEDYALVALAWMVARGRTGVGLGFCWEWPYPWPRHVVAFDDRHVYSSGDITTESVDEYVARSRYDFCLRRRVA